MSSDIFKEVVKMTEGEKDTEIQFGRKWRMRGVKS